ncbi:MAG: heme ABC transporter ATP-binding protein [Proteobacteria bacterium]|nr:heme ABC transporter ATP-binding protein [Pseudomonadota bacterium]
MSTIGTLHLDNLHAAISAELALDQIRLEVPAGSATAIIGPNGAGKTSLLRAICGELDLQLGELQFNGKAMHLWKPQQRAKLMAILPQRSSLEFPFTVEEVVSLGRIPHDTPRQRNHQIVMEALELVDCANLAGRLYVHLSGGEKQRVQLARVAAQIWDEQAQDRCLILDEPSASLDLAHQAMLVGMMRFFARQGVAILTVLHDLNLASKCADQIVVLDRGRLVDCGEPKAVLTEEMLSRVFNIDALVSVNAKDGSCLVIC